MINYGKQTIDKSDINSVIKVLKSDFLTTGPEINKFEKQLNLKFGSKYSTVVNSGTSALFILGKALSWKSGDTIITSPLTFVATANCIINNDARVQFVDIDRETFTIDPNKLEEKLKKGKRVKAVIAMDYAGHPCDWKSLSYLSKKYKFKLINDGCHSLGSKYFNDEKYAAKYADFVTHSYHPVKAITTGEGGSILCNSKSYDKKIKLIRNHSLYLTKKDGPWHYEVKEPGNNFRLTDFQCALGISQLKKLNFFIKKRREIANVYYKYLKHDERFTLPIERKNIYHSYHLFPLQINFEKIKLNKKGIFNKFKKNNINLQVHYKPLHLQPFFRKFHNNRKDQLIVSESLYKKEISLPIFPSLKKIDLFKVIKQLLSIK